MNCTTIDGYINLTKIPIRIHKKYFRIKVNPNKKSWEKYLQRQNVHVYEYEHTKILIDETEQIFNELSSKWRRETRALSMMIHKTILNSTYRKIIDMGEPIVPYILKDLIRKPDHWFIALEEIYKEKSINPVARKDMGDIQRMAEAWIDWGKVNKII